MTRKMLKSFVTVNVPSPMVPRFSKMQLKHEERYSLLGPNESGKTTMMRVISNSQDEGIPDGESIYSAFSETDIQGELSHLSCGVCLRSSQDQKDEDWKGGACQRWFH